jgi:hypothetical protein
MVPVSFAAVLLQHWGVLDYIAHFFEPIFRLFGLRGEATVVIITAIFVNLYSAIAIIQSIPFTEREICIMALMTLLAHNLIIETLVQMKTGSSGLRMVSIRIIAAIAGGLFLNFVLPENDTIVIHGIVSGHLSFVEVMQNWFLGTIALVFTLVCIVVSLNILQSVLEEFGIMAIIARWVSPLLRPMGLPKNTAFLWIVAYTVGLAYGAAILIEYKKEGKISSEDADILNHHIAISHSQLEDSLLFFAIGASLVWITVPRIVLAMIVVWIIKCFNKKTLKPADVG